MIEKMDREISIREMEGALEYIQGYHNSEKSYIKTSIFGEAMSIVLKMASAYFFYSRACKNRDILRKAILGNMFCAMGDCKYFKKEGFEDRCAECVKNNEMHFELKGGK